ncbi:alpha/beta fold hydrolase [Puia sp. P3]|uniref:alpha/beta fold hydrolase n=1 Tax=Puia sp. P3 TaxID=3423952 RepID=UPI003D66400E
MQHGYYQLKDSKIHYSVGGGGSRLLICLHGYGESAESFAFLEAALGDGYTLLAIDFPFHGETVWKDGFYFDPRDLVAMLEEVTRGLAADGSPWTVLGYSMGGRIALHLLRMIPDKIGRLVLLAPDGLTMNPWYWLATQSRPGRSLFRFTMDHPHWLFGWLRAANKFKWVNPGIYKFTRRYIDDEKVRHELYARWTTMRGFRPDLGQLRSTIRERKIPVFLIYGRYDRIIIAKRGERFRNGIEDQCHLQLLPTGHQLLQPDNQDIIVTAITS